jgi:large-conductance mechanosensitive channel
MYNIQIIVQETILQKIQTNREISQTKVNYLIIAFFLFFLKKMVNKNGRQYNQSQQKPFL